MPGGTARHAMPLALALLLSLAACTSTPSPLSTLPPVVSPTPTSPTATAPAVTATPSPSFVPTPATAAPGVPTSPTTGDMSDAAAIKTAKGYVWAEWMVAQTQDITPILQFASVDCPCLKRSRDAIATQKRLHHRLVSNPMGEMTATVTKHHGAEVDVKLHFVVPKFTIVDDTGRQVEVDTGGNSVYQLTLAYGATSWKVTDTP